MLQERHPEWWSPAMHAAKRWLSHVVTVARPPLAQDVGLVDAVRVGCGRFALHGNCGVFSAIACLTWARSGELGVESTLWSAVALAASQASRVDVREAGDELLEMLEIWHKNSTASGVSAAPEGAVPSVTVSVTMTCEWDDVVVVSVAPRRVATARGGGGRRWIWSLLLALLFGSSLAAALRWWLLRRRQR